MEPTAGEEKELMHLDVLRERTVKDGIRVQQSRIPCEETRIQWLDEPVLKFTGCPEGHERERREDAQLDRAIGRRACVEFVRDMIRFAKPKRQPKHDIPADLI
jgi:hypothetical protein